MGINASQKSRKKTGKNFKSQESNAHLATSLLKYEKIVTTDAKAKELRRVAEKIITLGKRGTLHTRRQALSFIRDREVTRKVFEELSSRYNERAGGYTRIIKLGHRAGDNAPQSQVELV